MRGAPGVVEELERQLGVEAGETTPDKEFTLETVNCLGACALGPVVVIDGRYFSKVTKSTVRQILDKAREGLDSVDLETDPRVFPIEVSCPRCDHSLMDDAFAVDGHPSIRVTASFDGAEGSVRLSSLYGSYNLSSERDIPPGAVARFCCPHCQEELARASDCAICDAPMVLMIVRGGGALHICTRRGCKSHMLDLV